MTLDELLIDCCTRLNYPPDLTLVDSTVKARLTAFLNQTQKEILGQPSYLRLLRVNFQIITIGGVAFYGLPQLAERVTAIVDRRNQRRLSMISLDAYRRYQPDPGVTTGTPVAYAFDGWGATQFHPQVSHSLYAFSVAADNGRIVTCKAVQASGGATAQTVMTYTATLNAAIPGGVLLIPSPPGATFITDLYLDQPTTDHLDIGGYVPPFPAPVDAIARIPFGERRARYAQVHLFPTPSGSYTYDVFAEHAVRALVAPGDESVIPPRFHHLLAAGARMKEYELRGDSPRYVVAKREFDAALAFLNAWVSDQPDAGDQMFPDDGRFAGPSVLGPWFPASRYRGF